MSKVVERKDGAGGGSVAGGSVAGERKGSKGDALPVSRVSAV